jgi:hypothetical protein
MGRQAERWQRRVHARLKHGFEKLFWRHFVSGLALDRWAMNLHRRLQEGK